MREKLEKLGFVFAQPESGVKGNFNVILDCLPHLVEYSDSDLSASLEFTNFKEFKKFYLEFNK